jgi:hypothetical protein
MAEDAAAVSSTALSSLNDTQRANWLKTGRLPSDEAPEVKQEATPEIKETKPAPSPGAKQAAVSVPQQAETPAESVPAKKEPPRANAETRIKDLLAQIKEKDSEIERLRVQPAPKAEKKQEAPARPRRADTDEHGQPKFSTDEAYEDALAAFISEQTVARVQEDFKRRDREAQAERIRKAQEERLTLSAKMAKEKYPDVDFSELTAVDEKGIPKNSELAKIKPNGVLDAWLLDSEISVELIYHLTEKAGEIERIQGLSPYAQARELTRLEDSLRTSKPKAQEKPATKEVKQEKAPDAVTKAPAPAAQVSGKMAAPADEEGSALESEDFNRYFAAANAREGIKRKR